MLAALISQTIPNLKPCFTALSNQVFDVYLTQLNRSEIIVLLTICRCTTGYLKQREYIAEKLLLRLTKISRSALYSAISTLKNLNLIAVKKDDRKSCCQYSLSDEIQPVMSIEEKALKALELQKKNNDKFIQALKGMFSTMPDAEKILYHFEALENLLEGVEAPLKKKVKTLKSQKKLTEQQSFLADKLKDIEVSPPMAENLAQEASPEVIEQALANPNLASADNPAGYAVAEIQRGGYQKDKPKKPPKPAEPLDPLSEQLKRHGVKEFMARRLVQTHEREVIVQALKHLEKMKVKPKNPGGYLVSEIMRGGYSDKPADKDKPTRLRNQKLQEKQKAQKRAEQERAAKQAAFDKALLDRFLQLTPEQQAPYLAEVDALLPTKRLKPVWNLNHPGYTGYLIQILRSSQQDTNKDMFFLNVQQHRATEDETKSQGEDDEILARFNSLVAFGVEPHVARYLVECCSCEVIDQAIERLHSVHPNNPAAYLVAELKRGGYAAPPRAKEDQAKLERESFEKIREAEQKQKKEISEQKEKLFNSTMEYFDQLSPEQKNDILLEFEPTVQSFSRLRDWGPNHPAYQGFLAEFLQTRLMKKEVS